MRTVGGVLEGNGTSGEEERIWIEAVVVERSSLSEEWPAENNTTA